MERAKITEALAALVGTATEAAALLKRIEAGGYLLGDPLDKLATDVRTRFDAALAGVVSVGEAEPDPISYSNG